MATLERVMQMKGQGMSEDQIVQSLRQEGVPPRDIEESLSQSKIKFEVNNSNMPIQQEQGYDQNFTRSSFEEETPNPEEASQVQSATQEYYPEYTPNQNYQDYQPQQPFNIETINEMVEQAIEEKTDSLKKQIASFTRFKEDANIEIEKLNQRLLKIENTISDLQTSILRRIGDYGNDINSIAREMQTTQNTFSKIIDPLTDSVRELRGISSNLSNQMSSFPNRQIQTEQINEPERISAQQIREPVQERVEREKPKSKSRDGFENFLR